MDVGAIHESPVKYELMLRIMNWLRHEFSLTLNELNCNVL